MKLRAAILKDKQNGQVLSRLRKKMTNIQINKI